MSRIGDRKIIIPEGINVEIKDTNVIIKNSSKERMHKLPNELFACIENNYLMIKRKKQTKQAKSLHGTFARLISNSIIGLHNGFLKNLEYKGVGFNVSVADNKLVMRLGFSHTIEIPIPEDLEVSVQKNVITVKGDDKDKVGLFAAKIREIRKPEVYKGKGIRYQNENIRKKAGKTAQTANS